MISSVTPTHRFVNDNFIDCALMKMVHLFSGPPPISIVSTHTIVPRACTCIMHATSVSSLGYLFLGFDLWSSSISGCMVV